MITSKLSKMFTTFNMQVFEKETIWKKKIFQQKFDVKLNSTIYPMNVWFPFFFYF